LRSFDVYAGHGWASGHQVFAAGNNQESSSESMHFSSSVILWGLATNDNSLRDLGVFLYATEQTAIEQYWFDVDDVNFPAQFQYEVAGMVWGHGVAHAIWWEAHPEEIHGINYLPLTGGSLYLARRPDEIGRGVAETYAAPGSIGLWQDILWGYEAMANPASAIARFNANPNYASTGGQETGESVAHTYFWLHNWNALGQLTTNITANTTSYAVFTKNGALTCVAYNHTSSPINVTFSNGRVLAVPAYTLASTPLGQCQP
jgi:endoglucanase Acf2